MKKQLLILAILMLPTLLIARKAEIEEKPLSVTVLSEHGQTWAKQMIQKLDKEELELLANYLYFNFLTTRCEYILRTSLFTSQVKLPGIAYLIDTNEAEAHKTAEAIVQQIVLLNETLIPARAHAIKAAQACLEYIEDSEFIELKKVISKFQNYSKSALNQFIHQDWSKNITKLIINCANSIKQESEKLTPYHGQLNNIASLELSEDTEADAQCAAQFQDAIKIAESSYASCLNLLGNNLNAMSMSNDIANISAIINQIFYNHLLESFKSKKMGSFTLMFDENGLIEEDDRTEKLIAIADQFIIGKKQK